MTSREFSAEIAALLDRYLVGLDDDKLDDAWARSLFADDAVVEFPNARHEGIGGLAEYHQRAMAAFERTQHLNSPAVVVVEGDRASLRANLISTHVRRSSEGEQSAPLFAAGTFLNGEARRTSRGWRFNLLSFRLVWSTGSPPRAAG